MAPALEQSTEPMPDQQKVNGNCFGVGASLCLNLGGRETRIPGFKNVDFQKLSSVDIHDDVSKLESIKDASVSEIYASHLLEHFIWTETQNVLKTWRRVLKNGGLLYVAVPDFDVIMKFYQKVGLSQLLIELLYGEPDEPYGNHYNVFNFARLAKCLMDAGFSDVVRIHEMPYGVDDCSKLVDDHEHKPISLMVKAMA